MNIGGSFAALRSVRRGALIVTRIRYGTFRWTVTRLAVVSADDRSVLASTRPTAQLTLTTCYPFGYLGPAPQRFILTARLVPSQTVDGQA